MAYHGLARGTARRSCLRRLRRGATAIELAIVLTLFLTLVFGMLDLGIAVFRYHIVCEAARQGARQAIVHGKLSDKLGTWGPAPLSLTGHGCESLGIRHSAAANGIRPFSSNGTSRVARRR